MTPSPSPTSPRGGEALKTTMNEELINTTIFLKVPLGGFRGL
jgi:hypothetical protein